MTSTRDCEISPANVRRSKIGHTRAPGADLYLFNALVTAPGMPALGSFRTYRCGGLSGHPSPQFHVLEGAAPMLFSDSYLLYLAPALFLVAFILIGASVRILREYERAVVFTLGRFQKVKGPGLVLLIPFFQEMVRVDLRIQVIEIPTQDVISRDNVSMKVDAVLYFNVVNPERAIIQVQDYLPATNMLAQTTLRAVLGQHELDEMLSERKKLSTDVQSIIDSQTETWGIKVSNVEIRTVELTENMVRAIAKQAEAERDRRAKIIHAEAEFQASQTLVNAAKILSSVPAAMQLRYLQTLTEIGAEQNSTVVFPMPIDIIKPFLELIEQPSKAAGANGASRTPLVKDVPLGA
jgi:regulator of protease activity HflC (stomatin/prohibitin superfamily)